jgi:hypothetical protein
MTRNEQALMPSREQINYDCELVLLYIHSHLFGFFDKLRQGVAAYNLQVAKVTAGTAQ